MRNRANIVVLCFVIASLFFAWWASLGYPSEITICEPASSAEKCSPHYVPVGVIRWILFQLDRYGVLITAIATAFIGWFTWSLRNSTRELWLAGERHSERELRAYVIISDIVIAGFQTGENPQALIIVKNGGRTPAYELDSTGALGLINYPPHRAAPNSPPQGIPESRATLGPDGNFTMRLIMGDVVSPQQFQGLTDGTMAIHVFGWIVYRDVFGKKRRTNFSAFHGGEYGMSANGAPSQGPTGNDAD